MREYSRHSDWGRNWKSRFRTSFLFRSKKCPPPISRGAPSTSSLLQSPPAIDSCSMTRKESSPHCIKVWATLSPEGPAPSMTYLYDCIILLSLLQHFCLGIIRKREVVLGTPDRVRSGVWSDHFVGCQSIG